MNLGLAELLILLAVLAVVAVPVIVIVLVVKASGSGSAPAVILPPPPAHGQWYADPTGRFAQRWWTDSGWTGQVVLESGQQTTDPSPLPDPPPPPPVGS